MHLRRASVRQHRVSQSVRLRRIIDLDEVNIELVFGSDDKGQEAKGPYSREFSSRVCRRLDS